VLPKKEVAFTLVFQASLEKKTVVYMTFRSLYKKKALKHVFIQEINVDAFCGGGPGRDEKIGEASEYLGSMIQPKRKGRHSLRSESAVLLEVPRVRHSTIGGRAFAFTAPNLWNKLPTRLRNTKSLQTYKSLLKAHLFAAAFGDNSV
jgi:hypothetical protein